jgi:hypothetical protein
MAASPRCGYFAKNGEARSQSLRPWLLRPDEASRVLIIFHGSLRSQEDVSRTTTASGNPFHQWSSAPYSTHTQKERNETKKDWTHRSTSRGPQPD